MQIKNPPYFGKLLHKKGFKTWALYMFKQIENRKFIVEDIHEDLFQEFQQIYENKKNRENINVPPRSGKTTLAKYFIAYALANNPKCNFIYTSYSQELLSNISSELAAILENSIYKAMYESSSQISNIEATPINEFWKEYLKETEGKAKYTSRKIVTKEGGVILFASIGSTITGFGAGIRGANNFFSGALIIDDANKPADINSQVMRARVKRYYEETLLSRLNDSSIPIINIQQRLHVEDLSGFLSKEYKFNTLKKPLMIDGKCQLPSQYNEKRLKEIQRNESMFVAQYQQQPVLEGGNLFKSDMFQKIKTENLPAEFDYTFITADLAYKDKQSNDFTVFSYWGVAKQQVEGTLRDALYLIDCKRKKIKSVDIEKWINGWIIAKIGYSFRYIWIEDKSHGIYLNQSYRKKGLPVPNEKMLKDTLPRDTDKVMRANNIIPVLDNTYPNLFLCEDIENFQEIIDELLSFPNGANDDFVDTLIDAARIALFVKKVSIFDVL